MMMREQQWDRSNCRHFRIDVCLHQRIYMRAFAMIGFRSHDQDDCHSNTSSNELTAFYLRVVMKHTLEK